MEISHCIRLYLTDVLLVSSGKDKVHSIRHDVDRSLVFLPGFVVGLLKNQYVGVGLICMQNFREEIFVFNRKSYPVPYP